MSFSPSLTGFARLPFRRRTNVESLVQSGTRGICGTEVRCARSEDGEGGGDGTGSNRLRRAPAPLSSRFAKRQRELYGKGGKGDLEEGHAVDSSLSLEHFLLRDKAVKLWRDFLRASRNIPNPHARRETVDWLRDEHFEGLSGLRNLTDVTRIREELVAGNVALKRVCGPMELASALLPQHGSFPRLRGRRGLQAA